MRLLTTLTALLLAALMCLPAQAVDDEHYRLADESIERGIAYLRTQQAEDGSWESRVGPAVTGLALTALLQRDDIGPDDPDAARAIQYILSQVQEDGSIRNGPDGILASYNTSLCLSALAMVGNDPEVAEAIRGGQDFLRGTQWVLGMTDPDGNVIDEDHPYYGGFGYGGSGRPDLSNTTIALQALHDTGVDCDDEVFQNALTFLNRLQATEENDMFAEQMAEHDGGFIYATSINSDLIGVPESKANPDEMSAAEEGRPVSNLRTYGSMTYAGFKSLIYAGLDRDDGRVQAAIGWIQNNYELQVNPGMPEGMELQGLFYYYITMARAMNAYNMPLLEVNTATGATIHAGAETPHAQVLAAIEALEERGITDIRLAAAGADEGNEVRVVEQPTSEQRNWAEDLIDTVTALQHEEGWWANTEPRWMESNPTLVTAYALIALQNAID